MRSGLGFTNNTGWMAQGIVVLAVAAALVWLWRRELAVSGVKAAALATATLDRRLPHLYAYDFAVLTVAFAPSFWDRGTRFRRARARRRTRPQISWWERFYSFQSRSASPSLWRSRSGLGIARRVIFNANMLLRLRVDQPASLGSHCFPHPSSAIAGPISRERALSAIPIISDFQLPTNRQDAKTPRNPAATKPLRTREGSYLRANARYEIRLMSVPRR